MIYSLLFFLVPILLLPIFMNIALKFYNREKSTVITTGKQFYSSYIFTCIFIYLIYSIPSSIIAVFSVIRDSSNIISEFGVIALNLLIPLIITILLFFIVKKFKALYLFGEFRFWLVFIASIFIYLCVIIPVMFVLGLFGLFSAL